MSHRLFVAVAFSSAALLAGCATSPPMQFYVLSSANQDAAEARSQSGGVRLSRVTIPGEIDRPQLVRQIAPNQLQILEQDRWAAPLDDMIRRVLAQNFGRRATGGPADARVISLDITQFLADASCAVVLRAEWTLATAASVPAQRGTAEVGVAAQTPCTAGVIPLAMSTALAELAEKLLQDTAKAAGAAPGAS